MRSFRWQTLISRSRRQMTATLLLFVVVAALLPIPLLSLQATSAKQFNGKDHSRPFPCQDRPCGCRSAEQCKKKCCCFSAEQKLAWAKRNGVKASDVVVANAKSDAAPVTKPRKCCAAHQAAKAQPQSSRSLPANAATATPRYKFVIGIIAQECRGAAQTATGQSVFLIPPMATLKPIIETIDERFVLTGSRFAQLVAEPPVPPPRLFAA